MLTLEARPHRRDVLANSRQPQKLFVLLRLQIDPDLAEKAGETRVAVALAVDTSGSMYAHLPGGTAKIDRAIETIAAIGEVDGIDRDIALSIIQFDTEASALLPLTDLGRDAAHRIGDEARRLRNFGGGTNLARALRLVLGELEKADPDAVRKAVVLTDGETTDENECLSLTARFAEAEIPLMCVGLGADYNEDFLATLADRTNGFLYHLSESEASMIRFREALEQALLKSRGELATNVNLAFGLEAGLRLDAVTRVYPMVQVISPTAAGGLRLGNVGTEADTVLIAELELPNRSTGSAVAIHVDLTFDVPAFDEKGRHLAQTVRVGYTDDAARAARLDQEVVFFVQQARVSAFADQAVRLTRQGRLHEARKSMVAVHELSARLGNTAVSRAAERAAVELSTHDTLLPDTAKSIKAGARTLTLLSPPTRQQS